MALSNADAARKLRRSARYAERLAELIEDDERRRNISKFSRAA
jgi:hypothetical protein